MEYDISNAIEEENVEYENANRDKIKITVVKEEEKGFCKIHGEWNFDTGERIEGLRVLVNHCVKCSAISNAKIDLKRRKEETKRELAWAKKRYDDEKKAIESRLIEAKDRLALVKRKGLTKFGEPILCDWEIPEERVKEAKKIFG